MISLGGGYYYTRGAFGVSCSNSEKIGNGTQEWTQTTDAAIKLSYITQVAFAQLQISKTWSKISLFAGARGIVSNTTTKWAWYYDTSTDSDDDEIKNACNQNESDDGTVTNDGFSKTYSDGKWDFSGIQPQVYAGISFHAWKVQFGLSACADVRSFFDQTYAQKYIFSGVFSTHLQL